MGLGVPPDNELFFTVGTNVHARMFQSYHDGSVYIDERRLDRPASY